MSSLGLRNGVRGNSIAAVNNTANTPSVSKPPEKKATGRSSTTEAGYKAPPPNITVLAFRDGDENSYDVTTLPFAFRVTEIRDGSYISGSRPASAAENDSFKQVRIKNYFSCGYDRLYVTLLKEYRKGRKLNRPSQKIHVCLNVYLTFFKSFILFLNRRIRCSRRPKRALDLI